MATSQMSELIHHLRRAMLLRDGAGLTDGQLLQDYISRRDKAALAALVQRHGPMVWGVCRRVLSNYHDAEDAFQATFLVLVRRAASLGSPELLANWLYGVAHQTALKARATATKRKGRERQVTDMPEPAVTQEDQWRDLQPVLDAELSRLPDKFRGVIVLCDLEGKTRKEVAGQLGCPEGTVASRLVRARIMLAKRLTQRGVALWGGALAAVLAQQAVSAGVPNSVVASTIKAASLLAAGKAAATAAISVKVAALTEGVMKAMLFTKLKAAIAIVLGLGFMVTGATILTFRTAAAQGNQPPAAEAPVKAPQKQENEKEPVTAWGKEVGGVQAGLGLGQTLGKQGEAVTLVVRIRNVGKEAVKFQYNWAFFTENHPAVTDVEGKRVLGKHTYGGGAQNVPVELNLAPGKQKDVYQSILELKPGKFQVQFERVFGNSPGAVQVRLDPTLSKLATGKLEVEIKSDPAPDAPDENGEIVGRLIDAVTGKPVEGATIACGAIINDSGKGGGANAVTDAAGRYRLLVPSPGIYNVWLKKFDKDPSKTAGADDGILVEAGKVAPSQLHLVNGRKVAGKVVGSDGKPVAKREVSCYSPSRPPSGGPQSAQTDADGTFAFSLPPGRAYIYVIESDERPGYSPFGVLRSAQADIQVPATGKVAALTLTLQKTRIGFGDPEWLKRSTPGTQIVSREGNQAVTGSVVDAGGKPVAGAKVFRADGPLLPTNDKGEFRVETMKGTQFVMHTFAPGYHVWFGTPTSGDVLKIVLEPKQTPLLGLKTK